MQSAVGILVGSVLSVAQAQPEPKPEPAAQPRMKFEELPPAARLGIRAEGVRRRVGVISTVVLVPDKASYVAAIAAWSMAAREGNTQSIGARFPVLIDDHSWRA